MLTRRRWAATCGLALVAELATPTAGAYGSEPPPVVVSPNGRGWVDTTVEDIGVPARVAPAVKLRRPPARTCTQSKSLTAGGYATAAQFASGDYPGAGPGGWVVRQCSDGAVDVAWVPSRPTLPAMTAEDLARRATNRLRLPLPAPRFEPRRTSSAGPATLVAIPTWFYLDSWAPVSQRTRAGGVWAEVTATPQDVSWWPGDGSPPLRCTGPGRAWSTTTATAPLPCRFTYRRSSAAQPGNTYTARVLVSWRVTWRAAGGMGGTFPLMERQNTFLVAVAERQTVVTVRN